MIFQDGKDFVDRSEVLELASDPTRLRDLEESQVDQVLSRSIKVLRKEKPLVRTFWGPHLFAGDTHGDTAAAALTARYLESGKVRYAMFLGDYIDRGDWQVSNMLLLLILKVRFPKRLILLRGNHETESVNAEHGFRDMVEKRFSSDLMDRFNEVFSQMPLAAVTREGIFAVHGGIPQSLVNLRQIEELSKGRVEPQRIITNQLIWNDPKENIAGFEDNMTREMYKYFGPDVFLTFMESNGLKLMVRSHECFPEGFRYFFDDRLLSIFSHRDYDDGNKALVAIIRKGLKVDLENL